MSKHNVCSEEGLYTLETTVSKSTHVFNQLHSKPSIIVPIYQFQYTHINLQGVCVHIYEQCGCILNYNSNTYRTGRSGQEERKCG